MKRYLVFAGMEYYPCGGCDDLVASFGDLESAKEYASLRVRGRNALDWAHVYDCETEQEVYDAVRPRRYTTGGCGTSPPAVTEDMLRLT